MQRNNFVKLFGILRYNKICVAVLNLTAVCYRTFLLWNKHWVFDIAVFIKCICQKRKIVGTSAVFRNNNGIVFIDCFKLIVCHRFKAVEQTECGNNQSRTACHTDNSHTKSYLVSEQISCGQLWVKAHMWPQRFYAFKQNSLARLWCFRPHNSRRLFVQRFSTHYNRHNNRADNCGNNSENYACIVWYQRYIADVVHNFVSIINYKRQGENAD